MSNKVIEPLCDGIDLDFNFYMFPNIISDLFLHHMSGAEAKIIIYILRQTIGYNQVDRKITLNEFMNGRKRKDGTPLDYGVGLSKPAIIKALNDLAAHGIIKIEVDNSDRGQIKKYYSLNRKKNADLAEDDVKKDGTTGKESLHGDVKKVYMPSKETLHRTLEIHSKKNTEEKNLDKNHAATANAIADAPLETPSKPKPPNTIKERKRDPIFDLICEYSFHCDPAKIGESGARVGRMKKEMLAIRAKLTPQELKAGYEYFKAKFHDLDMPRDAIKIMDWVAEAARQVVPSMNTTPFYERGDNNCEVCGGIGFVLSGDDGMDLCKACNGTGERQ